MNNTFLQFNSQVKTILLIYNKEIGLHSIKINSNQIQTAKFSETLCYIFLYP